VVVKIGAWDVIAKFNVISNRALDSLGFQVGVTMFARG
jgi:hypothetical protein